jgi:hypothetical protein
MKAAASLLFTLFAVSASAQQLTNTCYFLIGPSAGSTRRFDGYPPIAVGSSCNDGAGSSGVAVPNGTQNPQGRFGMQGDQPVCTDLLGTRVPYQLNSAIPKSGLATVSGNQPVIFLKAEDLRRYSPPVQRFLYAHECGHQALGQVIAALYFRVNLGPNEELAADCFAANELIRVGRMTNEDWNEIAAFLSAVPGDPTTFAGPERVRRLRNCIR